MTDIDWTAIEENVRCHKERWGNPVGAAFSPTDKTEPEPKGLQSLDLAALANIPPTNKVFAIERLAPLGEVTLFTGPGSAGKSLLGQQLATAAAAGLPCLGLHIIAGAAIYLTAEDDADQLHWRQKHICDAMHTPMTGLAGKLHLVSLRGALDSHLATFSHDGTLMPSKGFDRLRDKIKETSAKLAILDNLAHLFTGNENDRGNVTRFVNLLNRLAGETGAAIILLGHPNKSGDSYSGSTAWLNAVRSQFTIDREKDEDGNAIDPDVRILTVGKANYAQTGEALRFRWHNWAFVREADLPKDQRDEIAEVIQASSDNAIFLRCLEERNRQERPVSESKASRTYAPKEFAAMAESKRIGRARLEAAMDRLFRKGELEIGLVCRTGRKDRYGLLPKCADLRADPAPTGCADPAPTPRSPAPSHTPYTSYKDGAAPRPAASPKNGEVGQHG